MLHKARLFFGAAAVSLFLGACTDEPVKEQAQVEGHAEVTDVQEDYASENSESKKAESETAETEESENQKGAVEEAGEEETGTKEYSSAKENGASTESLEPDCQKAVDRFIETTGLNIENYTFSFETTDEFVEITIYEKQETDQTHTPLAGIYRYMFDSEEILVQDYLTGAFIPYEKAE